MVNLSDGFSLGFCSKSQQTKSDTGHSLTESRKANRLPDQVPHRPVRGRAVYWGEGIPHQADQGAQQKRHGALTKRATLPPACIRRKLNWKSAVIRGQENHLNFNRLWPSTLHIHSTWLRYILSHCEDSLYSISTSRINVRLPSDFHPFQWL